MRGLGTIANVAAIILAGLLGLLLKKGIKERFQEILTQVMGLCVIFIGISGALTGLIAAEGKSIITSSGSMRLIASLLIGALAGELINIEGLFEKFGAWLKEKTKSRDDKGFIDGFVTASLTVCIGAMAIVGSIEDGVSGNAATLYTKAILDFVIILVFASLYGKGVVFSAIPVGILQGSITLCAVLIAPYLTEAMINGISFVGSVLIFCVGINLCFGKKFRVANMLPSLLVIAAINYFLQ